MIRKLVAMLIVSALIFIGQAVVSPRAADACFWYCPPSQSANRIVCDWHLNWASNTWTMRCYYLV